MIWSKPVHSSRTFFEFIGHKDCGFPAVVLELLNTPDAMLSERLPHEYAYKRPLVFVPDIKDIKKVVQIVRYFAPYTDSAFWISGRGVKDAIRRIGVSSWLEMPIRQAYVDCDILIVDDLPRTDRGDPNYQDALEIDRILKERTTRHGQLTVLVGNNFDDLVSVIQYKALRELQKGLQ